MGTATGVGAGAAGVHGLGSLPEAAGVVFTKAGASAWGGSRRGGSCTGGGMGQCVHGPLSGITSRRPMLRNVLRIRLAFLMATTLEL